MRGVGDDEWEALRMDYERIVRENTGAPADVAMKVAVTMVRIFRERFAGDRLYISRERRYDEAAVLRELKPHNIDQVCSRHHIHRSTVYRIVERARARGEDVPNLPRPPSPAPQIGSPALRRPGSKPDDFNW